MDSWSWRIKLNSENGSYRNALPLILDYQSSFTRLLMNCFKVYSKVDFESRLRVAFVVDYAQIGGLHSEYWQGKRTTGVQTWTVAT